LNFVNQSFTSVKDWIDDFIKSRDLSADKILGSLSSYIEFTDDKLDYLSAFLDMSTNYFEHTGTQGLARRLIRRAMAEV